jgi:cell wall-associated NlpC family hydrolase
MNFKKFSSVILSLIVFSFFICSSAFAQNSRPRIISNDQNDQINPDNQTYRSSQPTSQPTSRPPLTNNISVVESNPYVKKTGSSAPTNPALANAANNSMLAAFNGRLMQSMQSKLGVPYLYGSTGPNRYDCSGIVWSVFREVGINLSRSSARSYWQEFEPVYGDERFKFGTLVFFNNLGHMGIVVDKDTFYQASSSKGVIFTKFAGYWQNRIVGFRRIPLPF